MDVCEVLVESRSHIARAWLESDNKSPTPEVRDCSDADMTEYSMLVAGAVSWRGVAMVRRW